MATKLSKIDAPTEWNHYLGRPDSGERQRRIAHLRELVASGAYKVNLEHLAAALIRRGGLMHGVEHSTFN